MDDLQWSIDYTIVFPGPHTSYLIDPAVFTLTEYLISIRTMFCQFNGPMLQPGR